MSLTLYRLPIEQPGEGRGAWRPVIATVGGRAWPGLENARDPDQMPAGEYELVMAMMRRARMRGLWLPGTELFGHRANYADQLRGCWAIGSIWIPGGVAASGRAFDELFGALGGYLERRRVPFACVDLVDGAEVAHVLDQHGLPTTGYSFVRGRGDPPP